MQASGAGRDGAMAAIIGLDDARLPELVARGGGPRHRSASRTATRPGQVVVSGERAAIEAAAEIAKELGAHARRSCCRCRVAAHSPLMAEAAAGDARGPRRRRVPRPDVPLLANADARPITTADGARAELVEHLTAGVDWVAAVERMTAAGVDTFIEVGPGRVLTGLIKRIAPDAERDRPRRPVVARPTAPCPSPRPTPA